MLMKDAGAATAERMREGEPAARSGGRGARRWRSRAIRQRHATQRSMRGAHQEAHRTHRWRGDRPSR
eukprot:scaffold1691_cov378-Prasinococcus_capsulatus_cf.AAC.4